MSDMRVLIVDDEPLARARLVRLLSEEPSVQIVGEASDGREALEAIQAQRPDLVFLDVQMPEMNGFETLAALPPEERPGVVFVTAYDEFALRAFEVHALDYLLKPVDPERLARTLERVQRLLATRAPDADRYAPLLRELRAQPAFLERIAVRVQDKLVLVRAGEIDWIEGEGNYVRLHVGARSLQMRERMQTLEDRLDPARFLRIHRSTIVNIDRIAAFEPLPDGDFVIILAGGRRLPSTRAYRERIRAVVAGFRP